MSGLHPLSPLLTLSSQPSPVVFVERSMLLLLRRSLLFTSFSPTPPTYRLSRFSLTRVPSGKESRPLSQCAFPRGLILGQGTALCLVFETSSGFEDKSRSSSSPSCSQFKLQKRAGEAFGFSTVSLLAPEGDGRRLCRLPCATWPTADRTAFLPQPRCFQPGRLQGCCPAKPALQLGQEASCPHNREGTAMEGET